MTDAVNAASGPLLTIAEAAAFLNVSKATMRRWTNEGRLSCLRIGARDERRFRKSDLIEFAYRSGAARGDRDATPAHSSPTDCTAVSHCCIISTDTDEEWSTLAPEILRSLGEGAQVLVIEDDRRRKSLESCLAENGLDKRELLASHALRCVSIEHSYFLSGAMQWDRAVAFVESAILEAKARGFENILVVGAGSWAGDFQGDDVVGELKKYELGLGRMLSRHPGATVLCPYAATQVSSQMIVQAFATHPAMRIQSKLVPGLLERPVSGQG